MIPNSSLDYVYIRLIGQNTLLSIAQNNLLGNLDRVRKVRTCTFLSNNGQTETGISRNTGAERYYCWEDTMIDCRNSPTLTEGDNLEDFPKMIERNRKFKAFQEALTERSGGLLDAAIFCTVLRGENHKRYNIRCDSKIVDFDVIRVGLKVSATSDENFEQGLANIRYWEKPFKVRGLDTVN